MTMPIRTNRSYADKWPPRFKNFIQVPSCFFTCRANLNLNEAELDVLLLLYTYSYNDGAIYPAYARLAEQSGKGASTVRTNIASLHAKGWIKLTQYSGTSNGYDLIPMIAKLQAHKCVDPARKRAHPHSQSSRHPPPKTSNKEDSSLRRINNKSNGLKSIGEIINEHRKNGNTTN